MRVFRRLRTERKRIALFFAYALGMRKRYVMAAAAVILALGGCAHKTIARNDGVPSPSASASAAVEMNRAHFSGVITQITPVTSTETGGAAVQITFLLPDGTYETAGFAGADGVSVGDSVTVDGQSITAADTGAQALDTVTMPDLLSAVETAVPHFTDNHVLGGTLRAADFAGMDAADVTDALAVLPAEDDVTLLCYIETGAPQDAVAGFENYADAITATYLDDPYAPSACTDACALAESASITSGDNWALMIIAPEDQKEALLNAVSAWQEAQHD